jgi:hypothetical protein
LDEEREKEEIQDEVWWQKRVEGKRVVCNGIKIIVRGRKRGGISSSTIEIFKISLWEEDTEYENKKRVVGECQQKEVAKPIGGRGGGEVRRSIGNRSRGGIRSWGRAKERCENFLREEAWDLAGNEFDEMKEPSN